MEALSLLTIIMASIISFLIWLIVGLKWHNFSKFFHSRYSYIDLSFLFIYFFEQLLLAYLIYLGFNPQIIAGFFSIIIITTAPIQNKCWESRTQKISEKSIEQRTFINELKEKNQTILKDNNDLTDDLKKSEGFIKNIYSELEESQKKLKKTLKKLKKKG